MAETGNVLLVIGGGISAYKALELIRLLKTSNVSVTPVLTRAGSEFVTPLSVSALSGKKVYQDLFDLTDEAEMGHIQLSRSADLIVIAPGTADLMARMASGQANDLASTLLLATDTPVMIAPAMNVRMWEHPATQRNIETLTSDGVTFIGPERGDMACGEYGMGRMSEPETIKDAILTALGPKPLLGKEIVVTSGPTHEPIDPVRYIANRSSGTQGTALAEALTALGATVRFVTGPATARRPQGVMITEVETASEMLTAVEKSLPADAAVFAAAVADWRVENAQSSKVKKTSKGDLPELTFAENPDILALVSQSQKRPRLVVGFAAETDDVIENATVKRLRKGCDWIIANDVSPKTGIMGGSENAVTIIDAEGAEALPKLSKSDTARRIAQRIAKALA